MDSVVDRFAIASYAHPDYEVKIESLPGCEKKGQWKTLQWQDKMTAGGWMNKRVALAASSGGCCVGTLELTACISGQYHDGIDHDAF